MAPGSMTISAEVVVLRAQAGGTVAFRVPVVMGLQAGVVRTSGPDLLQPLHVRVLTLPDLLMVARGIALL